MDHTVRLLTGETVMVSLGVKLRRRVWMAKNDIVLVGIREFQEGKVDILHKYPSMYGNWLKWARPRFFTIGEGITVSSRR